MPASSGFNLSINASLALARAPPSPPHLAAIVTASYTVSYPASLRLHSANIHLPAFAAASASGAAAVAAAVSPSPSPCCGSFPITVSLAFQSSSDAAAAAAAACAEADACSLQVSVDDSSSPPLISAPVTSAADLHLQQHALCLPHSAARLRVDLVRTLNP
jgi:hypothetical protein